MRTLAIETATEACSVALFDGTELAGSHHEVLGRGHAERLIPIIADMPDKGRADRILVSLGPGSFTGVRIGLAAARALGLAWRAQVLGYPTLALVNAVARRCYPDKCCSVAMRAGHGEVFAQNFDAAGMAQDEVQSLVPEQAARQLIHPIIAGTAAEAVQFARGHGIAAPMHPDARLVLTLADQHLTKSLSAIYGRPPDAKLPAGTEA
ncbi:tRNA (adenosine(37)-N6)-threonylcarbamoyltransferase complex dimerization subunit type 1 TsaB [Altererythrobacter sp. GH1-8]|uniref:tRNA (adenosine(37)-N6)-threonylcarbamoyltransferase complex dimerization subunit type 1 TsaB n=1 Tax=Altererythrobacter sp. GH1-8 TaxID=3349333 RepID=UPI00374DCAF3